MAKNRMVSTSFWSDNYIADLDPIEKLLFLYLLTNERSTLAGIYELPLKVMGVETGIETEMVRKILNRFEEDGKVSSKDGWVVVKNFLKYHEHGSPTVKKGIDEAIKSAPTWARDFIGKGIDTLSPSSLSSSLSSSSFSADKPREVRVDANGEERPKRVSQAKYPNAKSVFRLFPNYEAVLWNNNTTYLSAAQGLYEAKGMEELAEMMAWYQENRRRPYCPQFDTPHEWAEKYEAISRFFDKVS